MPMSPRLLRPIASKLLLDQHPGAAAAFSLRRLRTAAGPAVRVRRASDNAEDDFTPEQIANGTLTAWTGANDGYVVTWYDQSGNGLHATQSTAASQPRLVNSGVLDAENGVPAIYFDGANDWLTLGDTEATYSNTLGLTAIGVAAVSNADNTSTVSYISKYYSGANLRQWAFYPDGGILADTAFSAASIFLSPRSAAQSLTFFSWTPGSGLSVWRNGSSIGSTSAVNDLDDTAQAVDIGRINSGVAPSLWALGTIQEIILYPSDVSSRRERIEGNLAWNYGLQSQLPYDHPYAKSFPGFGSQPVPTDADTLTYLAAVKAADGTGVEVGVANAVDAFVTGCKSDGIWDAIKASCILAGARTLAGALVPLKGAAPTNNNFAEADYNRETGLVGDGSTTYLDSNRAADADPQDDLHIAVYSQGEPKINAVYMGAGLFGVSGSTQLVSPSAAGLSARVRSRSTNLDVVGTPDTGGLFGQSRSSGASYLFRVSGVGSTFFRASQTPVSDTYFVFATNGASLTPVDNRLAFYSIGEALDLEALDTRVSALITAIGNAI